MVDHDPFTHDFTLFSGKVVHYCPSFMGSVERSLSSLRWTYFCLTLQAEVSKE